MDAKPRIKFDGYEIERKSYKVLADPESPVEWVPHAVVWFVHGGTRIAHPVGDRAKAATEEEANEIALQRARWWISAMGNPKAALEDAVFCKLSRDSRGFLDYVIAEYFDASHAIPASAALSNVERRVLGEALRTNWQRTRHVLRLAQPADGEWILDAGCAVGGTAFHLSKSGARVAAFDVNLDRLSIGRHILADLNGNVFLIRANCLAIPFRAGAFDKVLSINVFEHLHGHERRQATGELWRTLKPGGRALVYTDNAVHVRLRVGIRRLLELVSLRDPRRWKSGFSGADRSHGDLMTPRELARLLTARGFKVRIVYSLPAIPGAGLVLSRFFCAIARKPMRE